MSNEFNINDVVYTPTLKSPIKLTVTVIEYNELGTYYFVTNKCGDVFKLPHNLLYSKYEDSPKITDVQVGNIIKRKNDESHYEVAEIIHNIGEVVQYKTIKIDDSKDTNTNFVIIFDDEFECIVSSNIITKSNNKGVFEIGEKVFYYHPKSGFSIYTIIALKIKNMRRCYNLEYYSGGELIYVNEVPENSLVKYSKIPEDEYNNYYSKVDNHDKKLIPGDVIETIFGDKEVIFALHSIGNIIYYSVKDDNELYTIDQIMVESEIEGGHMNHKFKLHECVIYDNGLNKIFYVSKLNYDGTYDLKNPYETVTNIIESDIEYLDNQSNKPEDSCNETYTVYMESEESDVSEIFNSMDEATVYINDAIAKGWMTSIYDNEIFMEPIQRIKVSKND